MGDVIVGRLPPPFAGALVEPQQRVLERMALMERSPQPATFAISAVKATEQ